MKRQLQVVFVLFGLLAVGVFGACTPVSRTWDVPGMSPLGIRYFASHAFSDGASTNATVKRALIIIHGMDINAEVYYCTGMSTVSAEYGPAGNSSFVVIAPRFQQWNTSAPI